MATIKYLLIISSNVTGLNSPIKRQGWLNGFFFFFLKKIQPYVAYKRLTLDLRTHTLKAKRWKKIFHTNGNRKLVQL